MRATLTLSVKSKAKHFISMSCKIFAKGRFELHKWRSKVGELEVASAAQSVDDKTYAKKGGC